MKYNPIQQEVQRIVNVISKVSGVNPQIWSQKQRGITCNNPQPYGEILFARITYAYLCKRLNMPIKEIGRALHINHSTVVYYYRRYCDLMDVDRRFRCFIDIIDKELGA